MKDIPWKDLPFQRDLNLLMELILYLEDCKFQGRKLFHLSKITIRIPKFSNETSIICSIGDIVQSRADDCKYHLPKAENVSFELFKILMDFLDNSKEGVELFLGESLEHIFENFLKNN